MQIIKIFLLTSFMCLSIACGVSFANGKEVNSKQKELSFLLDKLLSLSASPQNVQDELQEHKKWSRLFNKYHKKAVLDKKETKIYLFMIFVATEKVLIHTSEEISFKIVTKFEQQPEVFLDVLQELPFLIPSTCKAIKEHYDITNTMPDKKDFIKRNKQLFLKHLGKDLCDECFKIIKSK